MAATALSMWPNAVIMMTALSGCLAFSSRTTWMPSMSGNRRSTRATSGDNSSASSRPSLPVPAVWTSTSSWARTRDTSVRMLRSSSMTRMVSIAFCDSSRTGPAKKIANCVEIGQTVGEKRPQIPINYLNVSGLLYGVPDGRPSAFDAPTDDGTRSVLAVPLQEPAGDVIGVLQLINARDEDGEVIPFAAAFEGLVRSLAAQAAVAIRNATLEDLSFKDPLTGAYNRRYFMLRIEEEAKRHTRYGEPVSLVLIDVDHFKPANDRHGHGTGDTVLREVTHVLMENSRDFSIVTRYGGDEFAVLLVNTPKVGALRYAERILGIVARHRFVHGHLTVSMGVATLPDDVRAADELIPASDRALYAAKQAGRNNIQSAAC